MFRFDDNISNEINNVETFSIDMSSFDTEFSLEEAKSFWEDHFKQIPEMSILDILCYSEYDFSFDDFDISDMSDKLSRFDEERWNGYSKNEKLDAVESVVVDISRKLGLSEIPKICYFEDEPENCGCYYEGQNVLGINYLQLEEPKELLNTIAHELRHAFQRQRADDPHNDIDYIYLMNLKNYISPIILHNGECILYTDYYNQFVEAEARAFANLFDREE